MLPYFLPAAARGARGWRVAAYVVLGLGLVLRLVVWGQQRSIVLDEATLLRNYAERSYGQLFQNLDYQQYAPPLFSVVVKACIQLFGNNELAARLFPLLCSMATLGLFGRLVLRWLPPAFACLALAQVAFGYIFIDYATECKQYATDGFVVLALLEVAHWAAPRPLTGRLALGLAGLGMGAVWLSMASVFALAGIGLWLLLRSWQARHYRATAWLGAVGAGWAVSFGIYFFTLLKANAESAYLQHYHHDYFLAFPPLSGPALHLLGNQLQLMADRAMGKTVVAIALAAVGFGVGAWQLAKRRDELFWLALVPIGACLASSALRYYSLIPRLTLFFLPLVVLVVFLGLARLAVRPVPRAVVLLLALAVVGGQQRLRHLWQPFYSDFAEVRNGLEYLAQQQQPGELAFMNPDVAPVVRYYQQAHQPPLALSSVVLQASYDDGPAANFEAAVLHLHQQGARRVWLLYDRDDASVNDFAAAHGRILKRHNFWRGYVLLLAFEDH